LAVGHPIPHFHRAIELDPTSIAPYHLLSTAHYNLGEIGLTDAISRVEASRRRARDAAPLLEPRG